MSAAAASAARSHLQRQPPHRPGHAARQQCNAAAGTGSSLHRTLVNERLCMMAAAAAAAAAISRQSASDCASASASSAQDPIRAATTNTPTRQQHAAAAAAAADAQHNNGLIGGIKRRFARFVDARHSTAPNAATFAPPPVHARLAGAISNAWSRLVASLRPPRQAAPRFTFAAGLHEHHLPEHLSAHPAALAALLHQYQAGLAPGAHHFLFGPPAFGPPTHLLAGTDLSAIRPPPPSYNASMQDYRLRTLLQERAMAASQGAPPHCALQQPQLPTATTQSSSSSRRPARPPKPATQTPRAASAGADTVNDIYVPSSAAAAPAQAASSTSQQASTSQASRDANVLAYL